MRYRFVPDAKKSYGGFTFSLIHPNRALKKEILSGLEAK
jgi:hypothetical protein